MKDPAEWRLGRIGLFAALMLAGVPISCSASTNTAPTEVAPSDVANLELSPSLVFVRQGDAKALKVTATLADGTKKDVTADVEWASDNPKTATVSHGTVVGAGTGITTVRATYKGATGSVKVTVSP
jgi:hypothetical protein